MAPDSRPWPPGGNADSSGNPFPGTPGPRGGGSPQNPLGNDPDPAVGPVRKVFRAYSLKEAMSLVTREMGPHAVVISCENVPSRRYPGVTAVQITAEAPATSPLAPPGPEDQSGSVGGLGDQLTKIREIVVLPLRYPDMFDRLGIAPPKGVLMHGPPGCGKTLIARTLAKEAGAAFFSVNGPELLGGVLGETEQNLRKLFENAQKRAPSLIFFDEIDSIAVRRDDAGSGAERRLVTQLLTLLDGVDARGRIVVLAATNRPEALDSALRRPGRFDREVEIPVPNETGRLEILRIHTRKMSLNPDCRIEKIAHETHGYVGADLANLCKEAGLLAIREAVPAGGEPPPSLSIAQRHFEQALGEAKPSSLREIAAEVSKVTWDDVGGLEDVKRELAEAIILPLKHPELFDKMRVRPSKGVLLAGPPGTGKTLIARAAAGECGVNFIPVNGPSLVSKFVGETEKGIRQIFERARKAKPCIIFFDEFDAIAPVRGGDSQNQFADRLVAQLLTEMDGFDQSQGIFCLAATNRPEAIDPAVRRPGRFDKVIEIPLPDAKSRLRILQVHLKDKPVERTVDFGALVGMTNGLSGAEIEEGCRRAAMTAVRNAAAGGGRLEPAISIRDLMHSIQELGDPDLGTMAEAPRLRVLVVDDEQDTLDYVSEALDADGLDSVPFSDPEQAAMVLEREHFDLAVIDIGMPKMDGLQLLAHIRKVVPNLPVTIMSGDKDPATISKSFRLGAVDYLAKPFSFDELANSVRTVLTPQELNAD